MSDESTRDDPTIVKVHGDYLYDNLQNTDSETEALEPAMEDALQQTAIEYGLVVVGYGGTDDSIMDPLLDVDLSEYGIYWCVRDPDEIPPKVGELLERPNTHLVAIDGFLSLMEKFYEEIEDVELPVHEELIERAEDRADLLEGALVESKRSVGEEEKAAYEQVLNKWAAQRANEKGQYNHALDLLDEIIDFGTEDMSVYLIRGNAKTELGQHKDAVKDYNRAIEIDPENASPYFNRGAMKAKLERYEDAIEDFNKAIELNPEDASAYSNLATAKAKLERYEDAIEDYNEAIELNLEDASTYGNLATAKAKLERYEDAIEDYNKAIELDPEDEGHYNNRGTAKGDIEQYEDAIEDFNKALELNSENASAYINRGSARAKLEQYEDAIADYNKGIKYDSERITGLLNRAEIRIIIGEINQAQEDIEDLKRLSTSTDNRAKTLLLDLIVKILRGKNIDSEKEEYQKLCDKEFNTSWYFGHLDSWLEDEDLDSEKQAQLEEQIDLLREHK